MVYQIVVTRSAGSRLWDIDGNEYIDLLNGFGPNFLGHSADVITTALKEQVDKGIEVGPQFPLAGETAKLFCELTGNERCSFVCTGSEAVYAAMRLARTATGRDKIVVFTKDYHGNFDEVLVRAAGTPEQPTSIPAAPGIPSRAVADMYVLDYGTDAALEFIRAHADEIAAVLVEPVQSRRPEWRPMAFNKALRILTAERGCLLIFDEVITGLRSGPGGAQAYYGIKADLATYGKVVAGGMPIGIVAGKAEYMDIFDGGHWQYGDDSFPGTGVTFFAGTFVRHPLAIAAMHAMLKYLKDQGPELWETLNRRSDRLADTVNQFFTEQNIPIRIPNFGSLFFVRIGKDQKYGNLLFYLLREKGVFLLEPFPSYLTVAHSEDDIDRIITAFKDSALELKQEGFFTSAPSETGAGLPQPQSVAKATEADAAPGIALADRTVPPSRTDRFPLADGQREMWLGAQMSPESAGPHHSCTIVNLEGSFDLAIMRKALDAVIERHDGLRCVFSEDGTEVIVRPKLELEIRFDDLAGLSLVDQKTRAEKIIQEEGKQIFDLAKGPLIACRIIRLAVTHHQLVFTAQMIACDGWSHYVVFDELSAIYSAEMVGREAKLSPPISMREYALWQESHRNDEAARASESFWRSKYNSIPPPLDLPTSRPRPPKRTVAADRREITFSRKFYDAIKVRAKDQKNSSFALLLAAFQAWLFRLSGETDVVVGVPFSAQGPLGFDQLIGQCANTLPLRARLDATEPFDSLLKRTWADLLDAQENWNYTFGKLAQQLDLPLDPSRIPLVSVLFNIDPPMSKVSFAKLKHRFISGPRFYYQYDLGFNLVEDEGGLRVECDYNRNLFDGDTIQAWLASYEAMLRNLIASPTQPLAEIALLASPDAVQNVTESLPDEGCLTVHGLIQAQIERTPKAIAAVDESGRLTYAQLDERANRLANHLVALGVGKNSIVGLCLDRTVDILVAILGVLRTGAAYAPLAPDSPPDRKAHLIADTGARVILTHAKLLDSLPSTEAKTVCLDRDGPAIKAAASSRPVVTVESGSLAYLIYTSGSTGLPKGVEISHGAAVNFLISMQREPGLNNGDVVLALSPITFDISLLELILPLTVGGHSAIASRATALDPTALGKFVATSGVTVMQATPSTWRMLLNSGWKGNRALKLLTGGEALTPDLATQLLATGSELWNMYGPTETTVWSTIGRVHSPAALSLGGAIRNTSLHIWDDYSQPVPVGVPGELLIGGRGLARGYHNLPDLTADKFITTGSGERLYRTGDRVRRRADHSIEYLGRRDLQVKVRGCHVELGEIESIVRQHSAVADVAVELRNDVAGGPGLVAYLTRITRGHANALGLTDATLIRELRQVVRDRLPDYMRPSRWVVLTKMPQSSTGKLDRSALPPPPAVIQDLSQDYTPPESKTQQALAKIWQKTLRIERIGINDSFFDLGGQSLLAVNLFLLIEKEFNRKLPLSTLFKAPTIEKLAAVIDRKESGDSEWSSLVPIKPQGTLSPLFLVHGAGGNVLLYRALAPHLAPDRPLYGLQSRGLDGKSEPLRTIEAMAESYLANVRAVQPHGPYLLGGYCLGGTVAYEMAHLLRQRGEEVNLVAMLDTYNFSRALKVSFIGYLAEKIKFHLANFAKLRPGDMWAYLLEKARVARDGELANLMSARANPGGDEGVARATSGAEASVQAINDHAADIYLPKPYEGRLTLFKPEANYKFYPDPNMGWGDLVGGLDIVEFAFKPHAMLVEPYVELLGKALNQTMDGKKSPVPSA
ncbi:MAG: amino acid adenylation domain-containing protein [Lacunisphaera sp.]